jgi:ribonuclease III family protein
MNTNINTINSLVMAYLGDSIYEIYIRKYLISKGISKVDTLQKESVKFVSARRQALYLKYMIDNSLFSDEELDIVKRARNNKGTSHPKNTDIITYKYATGLEALIGYLYLINNEKRVNEIMKYIVDISEEI